VSFICSTEKLENVASVYIVIHRAFEGVCRRENSSCVSTAKLLSARQPRVGIFPALLFPAPARPALSSRVNFLYSIFKTYTSGIMRCNQSDVSSPSFFHNAKTSSEKYWPSNHSSVGGCITVADGIKMRELMELGFFYQSNSCPSRPHNLRLRLLF
jgi:hypothetical protein